MSSIKKLMSDLAGWLSWLEHHPLYQKVTGLIPSQSTNLGFGFDSQSGHAWEATDQSLFLSPPLSLPLLFSLKNKFKNILK